MDRKPVTAVIIGAGHRGIGCGRYALVHPDEMRIVGVADPRASRRRAAAEVFDLSSDQCWESAEELAALPKRADAVINATMDRDHVSTSLPLLEAGYDILLEKPFATNEEEMWRLVECARRHGRRVMICHVLRHAPFYAAIRERVARGEIGDIVNVQTAEHVSYHHMASCFVRGKWRRRDLCCSSMLMAKCCHDLDLIAWMKSGVAPRAVASFGSNTQFRPERAPRGAGTRCLVDCPIESDCLYSARKHHIDHPDRWASYVWDVSHLPGRSEPRTIEEKIAELKRPDNPFGRCVWKMDMDVVDHQSVTIEFEDGSTATHNMVGGTARPSRAIHLIGACGEIQGVLEESRFVIRHVDLRPGREYSEEVVDLSAQGDLEGGHGGGDERLVADFVRVLRGEEPSLSTTSLEDSVRGHLIGFCADRAMEERRVVEVDLQGHADGAG